MSQWLTELALLEQRRLANTFLPEHERKPVPTYHQLALLLRVVGTLRGHEPTQLAMTGPALRVYFDAWYGKIEIAIMRVQEGGKGQHGLKLPRDRNETPQRYFHLTPDGDEALLTEIASCL